MLKTDFQESSIQNCQIYSDFLYRNKRGKKMEGYSHKLTKPVFEPSGRKVKIDELVNIDKYIRIISKVNILKAENKITDEEYKVLILGATRFLEFSYSNIAEYYCNASEHMQKMMEEELLILLDIDNRFTDSVINAKKFINEVKEKWKNENGDNIENLEKVGELF